MDVGDLAPRLCSQSNLVVHSFGGMLFSSSHADSWVELGVGSGRPPNPASDRSPSVGNAQAAASTSVQAADRWAETATHMQPVSGGPTALGPTVGAKGRVTYTVRRFGERWTGPQRLPKRPTRARSRSHGRGCCGVQGAVGAGLGLRDGLNAVPTVSPGEVVHGQ